MDNKARSIEDETRQTQHGVRFVKKNSGGSFRLKGLKPEAHRAESGVGFLGRYSDPPSLAGEAGAL